MNWEETLSYLYNAAPLFQNIGAGAYKEGLSTTRALDEHFSHPHTRYRTIHVAGTNGKGSVSSTLAAVLQSAGLRVGLYTSPHLTDFRERIRVNGEMIPRQRVMDFVAQERAFFEPLYPSFFELTTALAFLYFAEQQVDVAVVEVGLGGRLDCTNVIRPDLSIITNISFDHQQFLGDTLPLIAAEKAGIIKAGVPVVVGETNGHLDVRDVFLSVFRRVNQNTTNSLNTPNTLNTQNTQNTLNPLTPPTMRFADEETDLPAIEGELKGNYQRANMRTVQCALSELRRQSFYAPLLRPGVVQRGLDHVMELTGLRGRWQLLQERPMMVCDAGHNLAGVQYVVAQLLEQRCNHLYIIFGMVNDKDYTAALKELLRLLDHASFYFTQPSCARALAGSILADHFQKLLQTDGQFSTDVLLTTKGRKCPDVRTYPSVRQAVEAALSIASPDDFIFVGGSCYVIADLLEAIG